MGFISDERIIIIIDAIAFGIMFGFRRSGDRKTESFNIGIGFAVDPNVTVLGDEFKDGHPAPLDIQGNPLPIRLQERDLKGYLILASFAGRERPYRF